LDNLPEEAIVNVEEDYQVCVRMMERGSLSGTAKRTSRRKKKVN